MPFIYCGDVDSSLINKGNVEIIRYCKRIGSPGQHEADICFVSGMKKRIYFTNKKTLDVFLGKMLSSDFDSLLGIPK